MKQGINQNQPHISDIAKYHHRRDRAAERTARPQNSKNKAKNNTFTRLSIQVIKYQNNHNRLYLGIQVPNNI